MAWRLPDLANLTAGGSVSPKTAAQTIMTLSICFLRDYFGMDYWEAALSILSLLGIFLRDTKSKIH